MKTKLITTASDPQHPGWLQFKRSLDHFGWDYHLIVHEYTGYNSKIVAFCNYLITNPEITHFIYADSYDSFALSTQKEVEDKFTNWDGLTYAAEKACWPYEDWAKEYPESPYPHKHLNGGGFMGSTAAFIKMYEANPIEQSGWDNDQIWASNEFLRRNDGSIKLDRECNIFQPIGHSGERDFAMLNFGDTKRLLNTFTMTCGVIFHGNGHTPMGHIYELISERMPIQELTTLTDLKEAWQNTPAFHKNLHEKFVENVNNDELLNKHRTFIEEHVYGMGERSFQWFWKLLVDGLPDNFKLLEIGVHKAQILSLVRLLADRIEKKCTVYGITPMNGAGTGWTEDDYEGDIAKIHDIFGVQQPVLYKGLSEDKEAVRFAIQHERFNVLYVDGNHSFSGALFDLNTYSPMIKHGGYLIVDDGACRMNMPFGYFQGIKDVCDALSEWEKTDFAKQFEFQYNIVHLMVYKRV